MTAVAGKVLTPAMSHNYNTTKQSCWIRLF